MEVKWKYVKPLESKAIVRDFLTIHQIELPREMVSIIEKNNGGRPSNKRIVTVSQKEYVFNSLLSYNKKDLETIYMVFPDVFKGTTLYPIGTDPAGNFICYDYKAKYYVFYDHELNLTERIVEMPF